MTESFRAKLHDWPKSEEGICWGGKDWVFILETRGEVRKSWHRRNAVVLPTVLPVFGLVQF